jgi:drug/metabolite transporter (DMT)-like permease
MSLAIAIPFGVASATVYGASIVVQHRVAQQSAETEGEASAASLLRMIRHPVFLMAIAGDFIGFLLQITALSTGSVVVIQPLVVLMLPVSLAVNYAFGGHRPRMGDYLGSVGILGGLAVFLALVGAPNSGHVPRPRILAMAVLLVLAVGALAVLVSIRRNRTIRGAVYGGVAGAYFGTLAVMVDAVSDRASSYGVHSVFSSPRGFVPLIAILLLGGGGILLTQLSFQVGALSATLPANLAVDPFMGVLLGAVLLREHIPLGWPFLVAYILCLTSVVAGAIRLAEPHSAAFDTPVHAGHEHVADPATG